jgi:hypothetical protein
MKDMFTAFTIIRVKLDLHMRIPGLPDEFSYSKWPMLFQPECEASPIHF